MRINFTCLYCGHDWEEFVYPNEIESTRCPKCKDSALKVRKQEDKKNYY